MREQELGVDEQRLFLTVRTTALTRKPFASAV